MPLIISSTADHRSRRGTYALASEQRQANAECEDEGTVPETFVSCADDELLNATFVVVPADAQSQPDNLVSSATDRLKLLPDDTYYGMTQSLNNEQQQLFLYILEWCRNRKHD